MYFETYQEALDAAIKQSNGKLMDTKLFIKEAGIVFQKDMPSQVQYKLGFTPDNVSDACVYNGEIRANPSSYNDRLVASMRY